MTTLNLEQRKALLWFRKHQPTGWRANGPSHKAYMALIHYKLIQLDPKRTYGEPLQFVLTEQGRKALEP
jgi:hypothetical protein